MLEYAFLQYHQLPHHAAGEQVDIVHFQDQAIDEVLVQKGPQLVRHLFDVEDGTLLQFSFLRSTVPCLSRARVGPLYARVG
jgi:hypothetical protein